MKKACIACNLQGGLEDPSTSSKVREGLFGCSEASLALSQAELKKVIMRAQTYSLVSFWTSKKCILECDNNTCVQQPRICNKPA